MPAPELLAGRYELGALLGRGGMGEVYDGWDRRLDRPVAVKVLNDQLAAVDEVRRRFETEAQAAARLVHPNVVGVYDTGEENGTAFIVMERLPGRTLADELAAGPLPQERVRRLLLEMLEGLSFAHRRGVLHRDIKPSNVLLTEKGSAKIADFGIAKTAGQNLTQTGQFLGTAAYLSPERLRGLPSGPSSDLYSVGVVAFEALTGQKPFQADTPLGLVRAIADGPSPSVSSSLPGVDLSLARAVDTAMQRRPEDRFESAEEMIGALELGTGKSGSDLATVVDQAAGGDTAVATAAGATARLPGYRNWKKAWWALLAGLAVVALMLLPLPTGNDGSSPTPPPSPPAPALGLGDDPGATPVPGVSRVEFLGPGTLMIEQTRSEESLAVDAPEEVLRLLRIDLSGDRLTIGGQETGRSRDIDAVVYRLKVNGLDELRALGSGRIEASGVSSSSLSVDNAGSANIELAGQAERLDVALNGSGDLDASRLTAARVTAELNGSGGAVVSVSDSLSADLRGSGDLSYTGNPTVAQNLSGSGRVVRAG